MHQLPACVDLELAAEPLHGALTGGGQAIAHFLLLLGDMDVDGHVSASHQRLQASDVRRMRSAQGMQGDASIEQRAPRRVDALAGAPDPGRIGGEAALVLAHFGLSQARMLVQHGQQGQALPHLRRSIGQRPAHRQLVRVGAAIGCMLQIVELADLRIAALQQFQIELGGDSLQLCGCDAQGHAIHAIAPGPEVVVVAVAPLGQACKDALESMAVRVHQTGQHRTGQVQRALRRSDAGLQAEPATVAAHAHQHAGLPATTHPGQRCPKQIVHARGLQCDNCCTICLSSGCTLAARAPSQASLGNGGGASCI